MKFKSLLLSCLAILLIALAVTYVTQSLRNNKDVKNEKTSAELNSSQIPESKKVQTDVIEADEALRRVAGPFKSTSDMVRFGLADTLGRKARFSETYRRENDRWILLCGRPVEEDGSPFDYAQSKLKALAQENLIEDKVCFLGEKSEAVVLLREIDVGSLDSPILSWMEIYELPSELIK